MLTFRFITRIQSTPLNFSSQFHKLSPLLCATSKNESSSEETNDVKNEPKQKKNKAAIDKLNMLLKSMAEEEHMSPSSNITEQLARPPKKEKVKKEEKQETVITVAKKVAEELGGDVRQTESELLNKLLSSDTEKSNGQTTSKSVNLRDLITGMKIDRTTRAEVQRDEGRAQQVRRILEGRKATPLREQPSNFKELIKEQGPKVHSGRVDIFSGEPLNIFKTSEKEEKPVMDLPELSTWNKVHARELRLAVTHPPSNVYEEMILWTEQGKLWNFPIDNNQGLEEEKKVYFTEHVFLEHHLEPWCPKRGPVRHFMELVCTGLSQNPHLTVQMKLDHINWYRDYFDKKQDILQETGALAAESESESKVQAEKIS